MPKYVSIIVSGGINYRVDAAGAFRDRLMALCDLVRALANLDNSVATLLFPAGFFCTPRPAQVSKIADEVEDRLEEMAPPFNVVWGVDGWTEDAKQAARRGSLGYPFFVFAKPPSGGKLLQFQQTAISAAEGRDETLNARWNGRNVLLDGTRDALLICGESWSDQLLKKVKDAQPTILLIPAHRNVNLSGGKSRRSWHLRLKQFNEATGIPIILSEHSRSPWRHAYTWGGTPLVDPPLPPRLAGLFTAKAIEVSAGLFTAKAIEVSQDGSGDS
jgi:hypothetical protein